MSAKQHSNSEMDRDLFTSDNARGCQIRECGARMEEEQAVLTMVVVVSGQGWLELAPRDTELYTEISSLVAS